MLNEWIVCPKGKGKLNENGKPARRTRTFEFDSVGLVKEIKDDSVVVWLIGRDETWTIPTKEVGQIDVHKTGDKFPKKICNICHHLLPVTRFARTQNNKHGILRRPSCIRCRTDIDKRAPKTQQARQMEKKRPEKGSSFKCPICQKRSITGITAKIVADHDHHTGNIRDFICDSCNTGLGRFKNGKNCLENAVLYIEERDTLNTVNEEETQDSLLSQLASIAEKELPQGHFLHDKEENEDD